MHGIPPVHGSPINPSITSHTNPSGTNPFNQLAPGSQDLANSFTHLNYPAMSQKMTILPSVPPASSASTCCSRCSSNANWNQQQHSDTNTNTDILTVQEEI